MATAPDPESSAPPETNQAEQQSHTESPEEIFAGLHQRLEEFVGYAVYYLNSRLDAFKFAVKRRVLMGLLMAVAVLAGAGAIITAVVLLCDGICDGLSVLLGHRWAGEITTGVLLLGLVAVCGFVAMDQLISGPHRRTVTRYQQMRREQRGKHGRDVTDRMRNSDGPKR